MEQKIVLGAGMTSGSNFQNCVVTLKNSLIALPLVPDNSILAQGYGYSLCENQGCGVESIETGGSSCAEPSD